MKRTARDRRSPDEAGRVVDLMPVPETSGAGMNPAPRHGGGTPERRAVSNDSTARRLWASVRPTLQWIDSRLEHWLMSLFYIYLCLILVIEVALRALGSSIIWAVETSLYAFIWLTYVSAAQLARDRQHLCFTLVRNSLGRRGQFACLALSDLSLALVCVVIAGYMWKPLTDTIRFDLQMTGIDLPLWLAMVAVPFGWLLVLVRVVQRFWRSWDDFRNGRPLLLQGPVA